MTTQPTTTKEALEPPDRIWIERAKGNGYPRSTAFYDEPISDGIEYARVSAPIVAPEVDENSVAFTAYNQAIEDAKSAIRDESQGGGYWAATFISAIARRCSPHVYVNRLAAPASTVAPQQADHLRAALENIASQRLRSEIEPIDGEVTGDFEGAYDIMINVARDALTAPASPAALGDEAASVDAERQASAIVTIWRAIKDHDDKLLVRYIKQALLEWKPAAATTPPSTLAKAAAEEIISTFPEIKEHDKWVTLGRVKIDIETETESFERATTPNLPVLDQIAAIIERCLAGGGGSEREIKGEER